MTILTAGRGKRYAALSAAIVASHNGDTVHAGTCIGPTGMDR